MNLGTHFHDLHATTELIPLFAGSLSPLDPYVFMLYRFQQSIEHEFSRDSVES